MAALTPKLDLEEILGRAFEERTLSGFEIEYLLGLVEMNEIQSVFDTARALRQRHFENKIFLYGFVYFSTHCQNNCAFCLYRNSNLALARYRKSETEILQTAHKLVESGVHLIDLTMGEDPVYLNQDTGGLEKLYRIVDSVKKATEAPLMLSPGLVSDEALREFKKLGVDWFALYQETHNRDLYRKLRLSQSYEQRLEMKRIARKIGLLIEEGLLTGVGEDDHDIIHSLEAMRQMGADQVRVMSFVPQKETPMQDWRPVPRLRELLIIAIMRLVFPDKLIPASLDVDGLAGLKQRLAAGANVVTSIIPPMSGLAGVSRNTLDIEEGNRTVDSISKVLENIGLVPATAAEYAAWLKIRSL